jgi:hypothetical protein
LLNVGKLKGIDDFDLSKIEVRESYRVSLRFHTFEEAFEAFNHLSTAKDQLNVEKYKVYFANPMPNYYDGKLATVFENCIKDKF